MKDITMQTTTNTIQKTIALNSIEFGENNKMPMNVDGLTVKTSPRFWTSICSMYSKFGMSTKLFNMFSHDEVFNQLKKVANDEVKLTIEDNGDDDLRALAVIRPDKVAIRPDVYNDFLGEREATKVQYGDGIVTSHHPLNLLSDTTIGGDLFSPQFTMVTPIDGFGDPSIYLSIIREVCTNGMIAMAPAFKSKVNMGRVDDPLHRLSMIMESYNNEEGYEAIISRMEASTKSWASVRESNMVFKTVKDLYTEKRNVEGQVIKTESGELLKVWDQLSYLTGDIRQIYGINAVNEMSVKKMSSLPTQATVYDLINFVTEISTHHSKDNNAIMRSHAAIGNIISTEYDLENSCSQFREFKDIFLPTTREQQAHAA